MVTRHKGLGATADGGIAITYLGDDIVADASANTYTTPAFTVTGSGLLVFAMLSVAGSARTWNASTINGSTTGVNTATTGVSQRSNSRIVTKEVTAGDYTCGFSFSGSQRTLATAAYLITGYTSATHTAEDTNQYTSAGTSNTVTFTVPANGVAIYVGGQQQDSGGYSYGAPAVEDVDWTGQGFSGQYGGAAANLETDTQLTNQAITLTYASDTEHSLSGAAWN